MSLEQLANVEVTSVSKSAQSLSSAAASIYVITREEILRSGVLSIPEALRLAPNLQVTQLTSSEYSNGARGFAGAPDVQNFSNKILILIDGRSVYSPLFSGVVVRHAGRGHGRHRSHRSHLRPGRHAVGRQRHERRHQHHHAQVVRDPRHPRAARRGSRRAGSGAALWRRPGRGGGLPRVRQVVRSRRHRIRRRRQRRGRLDQVAGGLSHGRRHRAASLHRAGRLPERRPIFPRRQRCAVSPAPTC